VGLDATSFPQVMLSRPLVAGTLVGVLFGDPASGALIGALLEVFQLPVLPMGAARYPDAGTAAVAAAAAYLHTAAAPIDPPALLFCLLGGLTWGRAAGMSADWLREYNGGLAVLDPAAGPAPRLVERRHLRCMLRDYARAVVMCGIGTVFALALSRAGTQLWSAPPLLALTGIGVVAAGAIGSGLAMFGGWRERQLPFLAGALLGALALLMR
jgi:hypothetical protein